MNQGSDKRLPGAKNDVYAWCAYREWSFHVLEGLLGSGLWQCGVVITTRDCQYPVEKFESMSIPVVRLDDPARELAQGHSGFDALETADPSAIFFLGWSWMVPEPVLDMAACLTLHPGRLPKGRGGSPIQNQMRAGDQWTWANLIELVNEMDAGNIFEKEKIELHGDSADAVWSRMTAAGQLTVSRFLDKLAKGNAYGIVQDSSVTAEVMKRVIPEDARIQTDQLDAQQIHDIIRAHQESDPNSYVVPAWVGLGGRKLVLERSRLDAPQVSTISYTDLADLFAQDEEACIGRCLDINNGKSCLLLEGKDGVPVYVNQVRMSHME